MPSATRWKVVLPRSIPIERICDLICMTILRLAFCQHQHDSRWLTSGGPSHYRHCTQNPALRLKACKRLFSTVDVLPLIYYPEHSSKFHVLETQAIRGRGTSSIRGYV